MFSILSSALLFMFTIVLSSFENSKVFSQNIPSIACPDIFQYLSYGNTYIGKIILNGAPFTTIKVEAQFSQREPITTSYSGRLSLIESLPTTQANLQSGRPITYRVDFPNPHLLPKLTRISVNERIICFDYGLPPPSTIFTIHHTFYPSMTALSRTTQPNRFNRNRITDDYNVYSFVNDADNGGVLNTPPPAPSKSAFGKNFDIQPATYTVPSPKLPPSQLPPSNAFTPNQPSPRIYNTPRIVPPTRASNPAASISNVATSCGHEGSSLTPFIVGGNDFERGRFPWLAAIYVRQSADLKFTCGGSLISARTVVTAAHCFQDAQISADRIVVYLGRHNLYSSETGAEQRDVQTLLKHPEFNASAMSDADIALLHMSTPVSFTQFIRPICLWSTSSGTSNHLGYVAGWGADNNGLEVTPLPKVVEVNIVSEAECLRSSDIFRTLTSSRSLCAGKRDGTGPCIGDSGGGLMVNNAGTWTLRAITSLGITNNLYNRKTCNLNEYVVYCDLSKHITWVHRNMQQ